MPQRGWEWTNWRTRVCIVNSIIEVLATVACRLHNDYSSTDCVANGIEVIRPPLDGYIAEVVHPLSDKLSLPTHPFFVIVRHPNYFFGPKPYFLIIHTGLLSKHKSKQKTQRAPQNRDALRAKVGFPT